MKKEEYKMWHYFYRELAKINEIVYVYDKIFLNFEINENRYSIFFQSILDSFTINIAVSLDIFFQERKNVWSLYRFHKIKKEEIDKIRKKAKPLIILRNKKFAHLDKKIIHEKNFEFFSFDDIRKIKKIINDIHEILKKIDKEEKLQEPYNLEWGDVVYSSECLIDDIKKNIK